ncbi:MAG: hypothetical protein M3326_07185 [Actinomycetota bacterium]|nr:hypothetical protein [Actinomycetota bacterium]
MGDEGHDDVADAEGEALLAELRSAASRVDPVPDAALLAARSAFAWRTMDAELAELTADSLVDDEAMALVRSVDVPALLTFEAPGFTLEVEVATTGGRRRLLGQLVPPQPARVEVRHRHGRLEVAADEVGRFAIDDVPPGPLSLRCEAAAPGVVVETDWFLA